MRERVGKEMQVIVRIPGALRSYTGGTTSIAVGASTVKEAVCRLEERFPELTPFLRGESGQLRPRVGIYVNDEHVRYLQGAETRLQDGDTVLVVPIIMGG